MRQRLRMDRAVGLVVLAIAFGGAVMLSAALALSGPSVKRPAREGIIGGYRYLYDNYAPAVGLIVAAALVAMAATALVAYAENRVSTQYRRSRDPESTPLAPQVVMADTFGVFHGPVTVTVLIPAHNEEDRIEATLASLKVQDDPPERIIVVADNCTDRTVELARGLGAEIFETVGNRHKKAGGLNQALREVLPGLGENDTVMIMDADTVLDQGYFTAARRRLTDDRALMAVGGLFYGEEGAGILRQFQRNEFTRYSREIRRRRGRVFVLTGTASVFRPRGLRTVAASRGTLIPGHHGDVYDIEALTEDNELTLALKSLGGLMVSPEQCAVVTEVMPTWRALWAQRLRWQRGALENLGAYGVTPQTRRYWSQQLAIGYGALALFAYFALMLIMAVSLDRWIWFPFWGSVGLIFALERVITVWRGGWVARGLAALVLPELMYSAFLNVVFVKGVLDIARGRKAEWRHVVGRSVTREGEPA